MARYTPTYLAGAAERARARAWSAKPFPAAYVTRREARAESRGVAAIESRAADRRRSAVGAATGLVTAFTAYLGSPICAYGPVTFAAIVAFRAAWAVAGADADWRAVAASIDSAQRQPATVAPE